MSSLPFRYRRRISNVSSCEQGTSKKEYASLVCTCIGLFFLHEPSSAHRLRALRRPQDWHGSAGRQSWTSTTLHLSLKGVPSVETYSFLFFLLSSFSRLLVVSVFAWEGFLVRAMTSSCYRCRFCCPFNAQLLPSALLVCVWLSSSSSQRCASCRLPPPESPV